MSAKSPTLIDRLIEAHVNAPLVHEHWKQASIDLGNGLSLRPKPQENIYEAVGGGEGGRAQFAKMAAKEGFDIEIRLGKGENGVFGSVPLPEVHTALARKLGFQHTP